MKKVLSVFAAASVCAMLLVSCQQERVSESVLDDAKAYFEANCAGLVLPTIKTNRTKSDLYVSIFPNWNDVRTKDEDGIMKIEVPIVSNPYVIASIVEVHDKSIMKRYATVRSYLEYEYKENYLSKFYVASVIERGVNKQASYIDGKKSSNRFEILSDVDGCLISNRIKYDDHNEVSSPYVVNVKDRFGCDFFGYKFALVQLTKDNYDGGEDVYGTFECQMCGRKYDGHMFDNTCPYCGYNAYEGYMFCSSCGRLIVNCVCPDSYYCPDCHRPREFCICDRDEIDGQDSDCPGCTREYGACDCSCGMTLHTCGCATEK